MFSIAEYYLCLMSALMEIKYYFLTHLLTRDRRQNKNNMSSKCILQYSMQLEHARKIQKQTKIIL